MAGTNRTILCPFCPERGFGPDPTGNLHIRVEDGVYVCHRCGAKPSVTGLLSQEQLGGRAWHKSLGLGPWSPRPNPPLEPTGRHEPWDCPSCRDFLLGRRLNHLHTPPWLYGAYYWGHRLFFEDPATGWWQARAVSIREPLKYLSKPSGQHPPEEAPLLDMHQENIDFGRLHKRLVPVIVEGPTDGLRLWADELRAVVLFGKSYSPGKLARLQLLLGGAKHVMLCLDRDDCAQETQTWLYHLARFTSVRVWPIEAADPGEMEQPELARLREAVGG